MFLRAEERLPLLSPLVPKAAPGWLPPHRLPACSFYAAECLTPALYPHPPGGRRKGDSGVTDVAHPSLPSNNDKWLMATYFSLRGILTVLGENKVYSTLAEKWSLIEESSSILGREITLLLLNSYLDNVFPSWEPSLLPLGKPCKSL